MADLGEEGDGEDGDGEDGGGEDGDGAAACGEDSRVKVQRAVPGQPLSPVHTG